MPLGKTYRSASAAAAALARITKKPSEPRKRKQSVGAAQLPHGCLIMVCNMQPDSQLHKQQYCDAAQD